MAGPRSARPRRAAAVNAELKVEESYRNPFGLTHSGQRASSATELEESGLVAPETPKRETDPDHVLRKSSAKRKTAGRKGGRKRGGDDKGLGPSAPVPEEEADKGTDSLPTQRRRTNSLESDWRVDRPTATKIVSLKSDSLAFKNSLQRYKNDEGDRGTPTPSQNQSTGDFRSHLRQAENEMLVKSTPDTLAEELGEDEVQPDVPLSKFVVLKLPESIARTQNVIGPSNVEHATIFSSDSQSGSYTGTAAHTVSDFLAELQVHAKSAENMKDAGNGMIADDASWQLPSAPNGALAPQVAEGVNNVTADTTPKQNGSPIIERSAPQGGDVPAVSATGTDSFFPKNRVQYLGSPTPSRKRRLTTSPTSPVSKRKKRVALPPFPDTINPGATPNKSARQEMIATPQGHTSLATTTQIDQSLSNVAPVPAQAAGNLTVQPLSQDLRTTETGVAGIEASDVLEKPSLSGLRDPPTPAARSRSASNSSPDFRHANDTPSSSIDDDDDVETVTRFKHAERDRRAAEFKPQRGPPSFHPLSMARGAPNPYFERHPPGSSIGAHSLDPLVGLPDHSDPRTFLTSDPTEWPHVLEALKPTIRHYRRLTEAEPPEVPLDGGYETAHCYLQARLRVWFVENRPEFAYTNTIPKLFKLERWAGGIRQWSFASNSPV